MAPKRKGKAKDEEVREIVVRRGRTAIQTRNEDRNSESKGSKPGTEANIDDLLVIRSFATGEDFVFDAIPSNASVPGTHDKVCLRTRHESPLWSYLEFAVTVNEVTRRPGFERLNSNQVLQMFRIISSQSSSAKYEQLNKFSHWVYPKKKKDNLEIADILMERDYEQYIVKRQDFQGMRRRGEGKLAALRVDFAVSALTSVGILNNGASYTNASTRNLYEKLFAVMSSESPTDKYSFTFFYALGKDTDRQTLEAIEKLTVNWAEEFINPPAGTFVSEQKEGQMIIQPGQSLVKALDRFTLFYVFSKDTDRQTLEAIEKLTVNWAEEFINPPAGTFLSEQKEGQMIIQPGQSFIKASDRSTFEKAISYSAFFDADMYVLLHAAAAWTDAECAECIIQEADESPVQACRSIVNDTAETGIAKRKIA